MSASGLKAAFVLTTRHVAQVPQAEVHSPQRLYLVALCDFLDPCGDDRFLFTRVVQYSRSVSLYAMLRSRSGKVSERLP